METSFFLLSLRRFFRRKPAVFGAFVVTLLFIVAAAAPILSPYESMAMRPQERLQSPSFSHLMGTDQFGRDILSRIIYGARISLRVGLLATAIALVLGLTLGLSTGYMGGIVDMVINRLLDIMFAFPVMLLAVALMAVFGPNEVNVIITIGIVYTPIFARICRGSVLSVKENEYIQAARVVGANDIRIVTRHIMPNIMAPIIVQTTLSIAMAIMAEAALSFLGVGTPPPAPSWGVMLAKGREFMELSPWEAIFPGLVMVLTILGFNLLGDGLRDALDPTLPQ